MNLPSADFECIVNVNPHSIIQATECFIPLLRALGLPMPIVGSWVQIQGSGLGQHHGLLNHVPQLPDISRPVIALQTSVVRVAQKTLPRLGSINRLSIRGQKRSKSAKLGHVH